MLGVPGVPGEPGVPGVLGVLGVAGVLGTLGVLGVLGVPGELGVVPGVLGAESFIAFSAALRSPSASRSPALAFNRSFSAYLAAHTAKS